MRGKFRCVKGKFLPVLPLSPLGGSRIVPSLGGTADEG